MKKLPLSIVLGSAVLLLPGCQYTAQPDDMYKESGNTINVADRNELYNPERVKNDRTRFGYVRDGASPIETRNETNVNNANIPYIDREALANTISRLNRQTPYVNDIATLVTDKEVLIAYDTDSKNRFETADQVKKTALSVVPRYYHVYVSDNPEMIKDVERFGNLGTNNRDVSKLIDGTIQKMLKSPQGRKISEAENENGEMKDEMNNSTKMR